MIRFYINGKLFQLSVGEVEDAVRDSEPEVIQSLAVWVNETWWPAKQPFVSALRLKNTDVNSRTALRNLERLGFPTHDIATQGPLPLEPGRLGPKSDAPVRAQALALAVEFLKGSGKDADDVIATGAKFADWVVGGHP